MSSLKLKNKRTCSITDTFHCQSSTIKIGGRSSDEFHTNNEKDQNPPLFEFPTTHDQITIYAITQVEDGLFTLAALSSGETKIIKLQDSIPVELIQRVQPSEIKIGDWLTIMGVRDTVRSFRITAIVLMESVEKNKKLYERLLQAEKEKVTYLEKLLDKK